MLNEHIELLKKSNEEGLKRPSDNLRKAQKVDEDEYYTRYEDVHNEVSHYKDHLAGKIIYCNCDDYRWSNIYKYLKDHFAEYKFKKLIATCYNPAPHNLFESVDDAKGTLAVYDGETEKVSELEGRGSFDSDECLKLLELCDVVITNPPFSKVLYTFIPWLLRYKKDFLFIAHLTVLNSPRVFRGLKYRKLFVGYNEYLNFMKPDGTNGKIQTVWLTTFKTTKILEMNTKYDPSKYEKFDNYDVINVKRLVDIPKDYKGIMGVPVTILMYNNENIEFIDTMDECYFKGKQVFIRIFIKIKN